MDSINANQPEVNKKNLVSEEAIKKIKDLFTKANSCFFCTNIKAGQAVTTRPMSVQKIDDNGVCWFLSAIDSNKNREIYADPKVQLLFQANSHSGFVSLYGSAMINQDKAIIKELWGPILKTWFTEGEDDPRITVIKFTPSEGYYWDTKHGEFVAFAKQIAGAIAGKTLDDSVEGTLNP